MGTAQQTLVPNGGFPTQCAQEGRLRTPLVKAIEKNKFHTLVSAGV